LLEFIPSLVYDNDTETIVEAAWGIGFYLERTTEKNERIKTIVNMNITDRLLEFINDEDPACVRPILRTFCHLSYGTSDMIMKFYTNALVEKLYNIFSSNYSRLRSEACWTISNFILTSEKIAFDFFIPEVVTKLIEMVLKDGNNTVRIEALGVLLSFAHSMNPRIMDELVFNYKVMDLAMEMLNSKDTQLVEKALDIVIKILQYGSTLNSDTNKVAVYMIDHYDMNVFYELQKKNSEVIYQKTTQLLTDYFSDLIE